MMMAAVAFFCGGLRRLQIGLQTAKGLLGAGKIAGLQGTDQVLVVRIRLAVVAKRLAGRRLRIALQVLLKGRQGALGGGNIARLQGAANGIEILGDLGKAALARGLIRVGCRGHAGYGAHKYFCL